MNRAYEAFPHLCECCGTQALLTPEEAFQEGWDYPPTIGRFGTISPRTCKNCGIETTLWWALAIDHTPTEQLSRGQQATLQRILNEKSPLTESPQ